MKIEVYIYIYILFVEITYIIHFFINLNTNGSIVEWSDHLTLRLWSVAVLNLVFLLINHYDPMWETQGMTRALKASFASKQATGYWVFWCWACYCIVMPRIGLLVRLATLLILPQLIYLIFFPYLPIRPYTQKGVSLPSAKNSKKKRKETIN